MRSVFTFFLLVTSIVSPAQSPLAGDWSGKMQAGAASMRLVLHIKDSVGIHVSMDSPDQNAFGFKADQATITGDSITVLFTSIRGKYRSVLATENGRQQLKGVWSQGGMQLPLVLERGAGAALVRPQTPKPPFAYRVDDVTYTNTDSSVTLGATLTVPAGPGKYPAVILITGSGLQDRDETLFGHKPFWVIADHLTRNGFAVLRVDDRGVGKSTGDGANATSEDFANDVITSINYLKARPEIDVRQIGLLGHSEGGMIAPIVAAKTKDVAFMILLAGPSVKGSAVLKEQRAAIFRVSGVPEQTVSEINALYDEVTRVVIHAGTKSQALTDVEAMVKKWNTSAGTETKTILQTGSEEQVKKFADQVVKQLYSPWFKYFLQFEPAPVLAKSKCPVLALYGEKDIQVVSSQNLEPMKRILAQTRKPENFSVQEIRHVNHLFQKCTACTVAEYGELTETFSAETLALITDWLKRTAVR